MPRRTSIIPLLIALLVGLGLIIALSSRRGHPTPDSVRPTPTQEPAAQPGATLSALAAAPDWSQLEVWQESVTREEFTAMMNTVFTVSPAWKEWFLVEEDKVTIVTEDPDASFVLRFRKSGDADPAGPRFWRRSDELGPAPLDRPLQDVRIAIDPGHLGGKWAGIEERWFQVGNANPVMEGNMTLAVAKLLKPQLEDLGATVMLVRDDLDPVTSFRPETLIKEAQNTQPDSPQKLAERLFYRTAEIRARAQLVNHTLQPDLVLCLHFNAEAWGDPLAPTLVSKSHFHLLLNGAYTDGELKLADQRFEIVRKIVEGIHPQEADLAESIADAFVAATKLPPFLYDPNSKRAVNVRSHPYLWARNLLANRLYRCPVIFLEPYVMNSEIDHARIQLGDYEGQRKVGGEWRPSIFKEYADAVTQGLADHFRNSRPR